MRSDKRVRIAKANGKPDDKVYRLTDIEPQFVSLVTAGANRQKKFQVVKADEAGLGPGGVCVCIECGNEEPHETGIKCNDLTCSKCGGNMTRKETEKVVPAEDASDEDKREAQEARAKQYGIEALEKDANLSYPSGDPTTESMYGDPVNLKYPFGKADNEPDLGRIRNALARFKLAAGTYTKEQSKRVVFTRIVERALDSDVDVSFDADDPIDALLPQEVKDRIAEKTEDDGGDSAPEDGATSKGAVDTLAWLDEASSRVGDMIVSIALESPDALGVSTPAATVRTAQKAQVDDPPRTAPSVKQLTEKVSEIESDLRVAKADRDALEKERDTVAKERDQLAKANADLRKERDKLKVQLAKVRKGLGGPTALVTGMVAQQQKRRSDDDDDGSPWASGGDLAQKATKKQTG